MILSLDLVLKLHERSLKEFGGLRGVMDMDLLESAVFQPFSGFGDPDFYPSVLEKAAVILRGIVKNHPFFDGN